jgi:biopolymer transport protein ExbD
VIMAERLLEHRHVAQVMDAVRRVDGLHIHLAVLEGN